MSARNGQQVVDELKLRLAIVNQCIEIFQTLRKQVDLESTKAPARRASRPQSKRKAADRARNNVILIDSRQRPSMTANR